jgi:hypothetical protein
MRWRPIATGVVSLIALQVFLSGKGPEAAGGLLGWLSSAMQRAMSPTVAGLPYVAKAAASKSTPKSSNPSAGTIAGPNGFPTNPSVITT